MANNAEEGEEEDREEIYNMDPNDLGQKWGKKETFMVYRGLSPKFLEP